MAIPKAMVESSTATVTGAQTDDRSTVQRAIDEMNRLLDTQKRVDAALERMPAGADKTRLLKERDGNRGYVFRNIILPAWAKIREWMGAGSTAAPMAGFEAEPLDDSSFGVLPLIPVAVITASTAILAYIGTTYAAESKILSDPALSFYQKKELIQTRGGISQAISSTAGVFGEIKWIAIAAAIGAGIYYFAKNSEALSGLINTARSKPRE